MSSMEIGQRIRAIREKHGLNQREFGKILNTSSGYISGIESGKNMAGGDFFLKMNREFGVDLNWLMLGYALNVEQSLISDSTSTLKEEEANLIKSYRMADSKGRTALIAVAAVIACKTT